MLVVDDDFDLRENIAMALEAENYKVFRAANGLEALDLLLAKSESENIGCIILDLMMPEMDGRQFLEVVRDHHQERLGKIPVIVATAKGSPINPETVPNAVERIQKPMELNELYRVVKKYCGHAQSA